MLNIFPLAAAIYTYMLKYVKTFRGSEIYQFILRKNLGHVDLALPPPPITSLRRCCQTNDIRADL